MKQNLTRVLVIFCCTGVFTLGAQKLFAQGQGSFVDRILNPLPHYDPFDKPPPSPKFFPNEIDKQVREALIDSLTHREDTLEDHLQFFIKKDEQLKKARDPVTGLTEGVSDLYYNTIEERDRYLSAQKKALASTSSPKRKKLLQARIRNDELTQADKLVANSTANKWGGRINRMLGAVDLVDVLSGSYIGAAVDSTLIQLLGKGTPEISLEQRKALALYLRHLKRYPNDPHNEKVQKRVEVLEKKKKKFLVKKQIERAKEVLEKGDLGHAEFHYRMATLIDPSSQEAEGGLKQVEKQLHREAEKRKQDLSVPVESSGKSGDPAEDQDLTELLVALTQRNPEQIQTHTTALKEKYPKQPLAEAAKDSSSVAQEIKGQHEEAKKILQQIARSSDAPLERKKAKALLKNPEYNRLDSFRKARSRHRLQTFKYVLLGDDFLKKNILYGATPLIVSGPAGATALAAANVIMMGGKLYQVITSNPISYQPVVDKGVNYVRNHPSSESATEVYRVLADAYEKAGMYQKAIAYHQMSGKADEKKIAALKDKAVKTLLRAADKSNAISTKERYLKQILDAYPESAAAKEAIRKLAALVEKERQGLRMSKKFLMENPEIYGPEGLRLKSTLFDRDLNNMELADEGINLINKRHILFHFKTPWGIRSQDYPVDKEPSDRFYMALRAKNYEVAISDVNRRAKGSLGGIKNLPMPFLKDELERENPQEGSETKLRLVRKATGPSTAFSRVLDHELLSKSEMNPGSQYTVPPIKGNISPSHLDVSGALPAGLWGDKLTLGTDQASPYAGLQLPIPLLQGFIPVDFLLQGRPGRFSVFPKIRFNKEKGDDLELYR
ncbi:MAG: tol-pal system YbgF family protein [Candidatus Binatia bacterium]